MTHYDWNRLTPEQLTPQITRKAIHSGNMTMARLELQEGAVVAEHSHHNEQITMVERGALQFAIDGGQKVVRAGEIAGDSATRPARSSGAGRHRSVRRFFAVA